LIQRLKKRLNQIKRNNNMKFTKKTKNILNQRRVWHLGLSCAWGGLLSLSLLACSPEASAPQPTPPVTSAPVASAEPEPATVASPEPTAPEASAEPAPPPTSATPAPTPEPTPAPTANPLAQVASLSFTTTNRFLNSVGETRELTFQALDAAGQALTIAATALEWLSSRPQDVTVSDAGVVTALQGYGSSDITVRVPGTEIQAQIRISVSDPRD